MQEWYIRAHTHVENANKQSKGVRVLCRPNTNRTPNWTQTTASGTTAAGYPHRSAVTQSSGSEQGARGMPCADIS
eukprot:1146914-Pelagomonas_calceolata.AAC.19